MKTNTLLVISILTFAPLASAETVRLNSGELIIGDVRSVAYDKVVVETVFPREEVMTLPANRLDPASHYELLVNRIARKNAARRWELALFCQEHALYAQAVVEARIAAKLDPKLKAAAAKLEREAMESLARGLLESAKTYVAVEAPERARLYLNSVLERYGETKSAADARRLLRQLPKKTSSVKTARITSDRQKKRLRTHAGRAKRYLQHADKRTGSLTRRFQPGRDEHLLKRAAYTYEKAYGLVRHGARVLTDDETLNGQLKQIATDARAQLVRAYLELGRLSLQRGSIPTAERYASLACRLKPGSKDLRSLHELIVQARIAQRFGGY